MALELTAAATNASHTFKWRRLHRVPQSLFVRALNRRKGLVRGEHEITLIQKSKTNSPRRQPRPERGNNCPVSEDFFCQQRGELNGGVNAPFHFWRASKSGAVTRQFKRHFHPPASGRRRCSFMTRKQKGETGPGGSYGKEGSRGGGNLIFPTTRGLEDLLCPRKKFSNPSFPLLFLR